MSRLISNDDISAPEAPAPPENSWAVSLLFWMTLLTGAALYAAVALAPKAEAWLRAKEQHLHNASRLVELENEIEYLERVSAALKTDPLFSTQIASLQRNNFPQPGETRIPVTSDLQFSLATESTTSNDRKDNGLNPDSVNTAVGQRLKPMIRHLASHRRHRFMLLMSAACVTLFAFTFLNASGGGVVRSIGWLMTNVIQFPLKRYRNPAVPESVTEPSTSDDVDQSRDGVEWERNAE